MPGVEVIRHVPAEDGHDPGVLPRERHDPGAGRWSISSRPA
jgi:hypothetical protein